MRLRTKLQRFSGPYHLKTWHVPEKVNIAKRTDLRPFSLIFREPPGVPPVYHRLPVGQQSFHRSLFYAVTVKTKQKNNLSINSNSKLLHKFQWTGVWSCPGPSSWPIGDTEKIFAIKLVSSRQSLCTDGCKSKIQINISLRTWSLKGVNNPRKFLPVKKKTLEGHMVKSFSQFTRSGS